MKKTKNMHIRLTENEHKRLRIEAFERNISIGELIRQSIKIYLETYTIKETDN